MGVSPRLRKILRALFASIALVALTNDFFSFSQVEENADSSSSFIRGFSRQLHTESSAGTASSTPRIFTFVGTLDDDESTTELVEKVSDELVEEWKKAWSDAGWNPVILTKQDAEKHELYNEFNEKLRHIIMKQQEEEEEEEEVKHKLLVAEIGRISSSIASTIKMCGEQHNSFCFLRYLAMASVGGGYMSDYNVFPLPKAKFISHAVPKEGIFTTYGLKAAESDDIPFLAHGDANEWTRMAKNLMEVITKEVDSDESNSSDDVKTMSIDSRGWRDTAALLVLNATQPNIFNSNNDDVLNRAGLLKLNEEAALLGSEDCSRADSKWAIYLSYSDVTAAGHRSDLQSSLAFKLLKDWNAMCFAQSEGKTKNEEEDTTPKIDEPIES